MENILIPSHHSSFATKQLCDQAAKKPYQSHPQQFPFFSYLVVAQHIQDSVFHSSFMKILTAK